MSDNLIKVAYKLGYGHALTKQARPGAVRRFFGTVGNTGLGTLLGAGIGSFMSDEYTRRKNTMLGGLIGGLGSLGINLYAHRLGKKYYADTPKKTESGKPDKPALSEPAIPKPLPTIRINVPKRPPKIAIKRPYRATRIVFDPQNKTDKLS